MFRRVQASHENEINWDDQEEHSDDSASSYSGSDLRSDSTSSNEDESSSSDTESSSLNDESARRSLSSSLQSPSYSQEEGMYGHVTSVRRRATGRTSPSYAFESEQDPSMNSAESYGSKRRRRRKRNHGAIIGGRKCTVSLILSLLVWLYVQSKYGNKPTMGWRDNDDPFQHELSAGKLKERLKILQQKHKGDGGQVLGTSARDAVRGAVEGLSNKFKTAPRHRKKKMAVVEALPEGCKATEWQNLVFPTCNDIHEIDLRESFRLAKGVTVTAKKSGFVGSGLWRSVWKVDPHAEARGAVSRDGSFSAPAVLKVMKGEHELDPRNLDRHRRDALVMERLSSSPNVVDIYGHCANTVLTEYAGLDLSEVIYGDIDVDRVSVDDAHEQFTRKTPLGRLQLALDVSRGLAAIHDLPGGPIIHADIQAKQFLVDPKVGVKLNDFNRCRFMPESVYTGLPCPVKIPSAPGFSRSPEEYEGKKVTEKIDIFSLGNVLYGILTGSKPFKLVDTATIKKNVKKGKKPEIHQRYMAPGSSDAALASLINKSFELDPKKRISASQLVAELESIMQGEELRVNQTRD